MSEHPQCTECGLLVEAEHRIANHFAMLAGHVRLKTAALARQPTEPSRNEMRLLLEGIGVHIDAVASLHRILATNGSQSSTDLGEHLRNICVAFRSGPSYAFVITEEFEPGCDLPLDQLLPVTHIFSEVITNAIKHGNTNAEAGTIHTCCRKDIGGAIHVDVIDEGCGLPDGVNPMSHNGLGFRLVQTLSKQVGGLVDYQSSGNGVRFRLTLPPSSTGLEKRGRRISLRQRLSIFHTRWTVNADREVAAPDR